MNKNAFTPTLKNRLKSTEAEAGKPTPALRALGATFDETTTFSEMKRLQDPAKFGKARFSLRLYRK
ncbi:hypothetical protein [Vampirovibrio sp.]|uniref:hypothetical protein n=1 Tax=Vampirovibrio sp. TaxID=2717857 RepID=UPI0035941A64